MLCRRRENRLSNCSKIILSNHIRANCTLTDGKYCFEVKIVSIKKRFIYFGFAEEGFVPNNKRGVGASSAYADGSLSWAISGSDRDYHPDWSVDDVIHCCIDIPRRIISYFVNGKAINRRFKSINMTQHLIFPVVSLCEEDIVEIRFNHTTFEYPAPI
eukprot:841778_1